MTDLEKVPAFDEMMQEILDVLKHTGIECELTQLRKLVADRLGLSPKQISIPHKLDSGDKRTKFEYNLAWACTYLKNNGYITNPRRGTWMITPLGRKTATLDIENIKRNVRIYKVGKQGETVTVPESQIDPEDLENTDGEEIGSLHTEIQWLLLKLGQEMNLDVWIANNDRSRQFGGNRFDSQPKLLKKLPPRFDEATQKTVELIDVLWLKGQAIVSAFEIENTSSIYSGLLRLSDLLSMQPDIDTPLYIVAPDERQHKVILEINRPTFSKATKLAERCGYISYSALRNAIRKAEGLTHHLSPTFIREFSQKVATGKE